MGKIIGAHGIRGALKVYSYAESVESLTTQSRLILRDAECREMVYDLLDCRSHKQVLRIFLKNVDTRDQAEALVGCGVYIPKSGLPPLEDDTYYWHDLIGMAVFSEGNTPLGHVREIIATGANDVYVVQADGEDQTGEILVPAIATVVIEIDVQRRRMVVALPEGLT